MKKKMNDPIPAKYHKVADVPVIIQMENVECGAASLAMVLAYYGKWVTLEQVRYDCGISRDGSNMKDMLTAAQGYGLEAQGYGLDPEKLSRLAYFPCIVQMGFSHFVVVDGFTDKGVVINDPAGGKKTLSNEEFEERYTGATLLLKPSKDFQPGGHPANLKDFVSRHLKRAVAPLAITGLVTAMAGIASFVNPAFASFFLDEVLKENHPELVYPLTGIMFLMALVTICLQALREGYLKKLEGRLAIAGNSEFFWHILHLPMTFFAQRSNEDLLMRQASYAGVINSMVQLVAPYVTNLFLLIVEVPLLFTMSPLLALVGMASVLVNLGLTQVISKKRASQMRIQQREVGKKGSMASSGIRNISVIKSCGAENGYFKGWADFQAAENASRVRIAQSDACLGTLPSLVIELNNIAVLGIGAAMIVNGHFSIGMLLAFQGFLQQVNSPINSMISSDQQLQQMRVDMERIDDVFKYDSHGQVVTFSEKPLGKNEQKLTSAEMKHVTFGYARLSKPVLYDLSLKLDPGKRIALVGGSGSGKSTAALLLSGLYQPWEGEITFNGKPIREINHTVFGSSVAVVSQDITIFEDTVANNIRLWDNSIEDFEVRAAACQADIHSDIVAAEGGYQRELREGGSNLSGGQRQRLEIARALAMHPTVLILDEATSALDAQTEYEVMKNIQMMGISCLVIAHRLSTVRDCDEIIVLDHGHVVERGTHDELLTLGGTYYKLVSEDQEGERTL